MREAKDCGMTPTDAFQEFFLYILAVRDRRSLEPNPLNEVDVFYLHFIYPLKMNMAIEEFVQS